MKKIITSASKIVFIGLALTACIAYMFGVFSGKVVFETQDFMTLSGMAFGFYFANKGNSGEEYLGK